MVQRGGAIFALLAIVLMWSFRDYQHREAVAELNIGLWDETGAVLGLSLSLESFLLAWCS